MKALVSICVCVCSLTVRQSFNNPINKLFNNTCKNDECMNDCITIPDRQNQLKNVTFGQQLSTSQYPRHPYQHIER